MPDLADFQRDFAAALVDGRPARADRFRSQAFAVYRNTSARGVVEALRAAYPTVDMLLGDEMFTSVALDYRREQPPTGPVLSDYGADFPACLSRQPWTSELPYLADVARLDWLWLDSFLAADASGLPMAFGPQSRIMLASGDPLRLAANAGHDHLAGPSRPLGIRPSWSPTGSKKAPCSRAPAASVLVQPIDRACHYLLLLCAASTSLAQCVETVAAAYPQSNVPEMLRQCARGRRADHPLTQGKDHSMATIAQAERRSLYGKLTDLAERALPMDLLLLVQRLGIAAVFFQSGRTKVEGMFTIPQTTVDLFEFEYALPLLPPKLAAYHGGGGRASIPGPTGARPLFSPVRRCAARHDPGHPDLRLSRRLADASQLGRADAAADRHGRRPLCPRPAPQDFLTQPRK